MLPEEVSHLDATSLDEVWAANQGNIMRREPTTGAWEPQALPEPPPAIGGLFVDAPDDVAVVGAFGPYDDYTTYTPARIVIHRFDGSAWSYDEHPGFPALRASTRLSDGRIVIAAGNLLWVEDAGGFLPIAGPMGFPEDTAVVLRSGADDALLALGRHDMVLLGDASGVAPVFPGVIGADWTHGDLRNANDVWIAGMSTDGPVARHFDGTTWRPVALPTDQALRDLVLSDEQVLVAAGHDDRIVIAGDHDCMHVEVDIPGSSTLDTFATDDVTGRLWGWDPYSTDIASFDGAKWTTRPNPLGEWDVAWYRLVFSDGKVASSGHVDPNWEAVLWWSDGGPRREHRLGDDMGSANLAAVDGSMYAISRVYGPDGPRESSAGWIHDSTTWHDTKLHGLPDSVSVSVMWAEAPDAIWLGLRKDRSDWDEGGLALWNGEEVDVLVTGLPGVPRWIRGQPDGEVWLSFEDPDTGWTLHRWDGDKIAPVTGLPPHPRAAHILPDGTTLVITHDPESGDESLHVGAEGDWTLVMTDDDPLAFDAIDGMAAVSRGEGQFVWTAVCTP